MVISHRAAMRGCCRLGLLLLLLHPCPAPAEDVAGSSDHPMLSRFPQTTIVEYAQFHHDMAFLPSAASTRKGLEEGAWVAGRMTWIVYEGPPDRSTLEIYRNYENALKEAGFEIGFSCKKEECGSRFINRMLDITGRMVGGGEQWVPDTARYLNARLKRDPADAWVSLMVYERNSEGGTRIRLEIIEENSARGIADVPAENVGQKSVTYDEIWIAGGGVKDRDLEPVLELEGKINWQAYRLDPSASAYEGWAGYRDYLSNQGYQLLYQCHYAACGRSFTRRVIDLNGNIIDGGERWSEDSAHYLVAKLSTAQVLSYASVLAYQQPDGQAIVRYLTVTPEDIEFNLITATGESMAEEIEKTGKVAVYGIYFDTDSADIKSESDTIIAEIARLLELRPELSLYVDGHTDSEGADDYNQELSVKRAASVVQVLIGEHGIDATRLQSRGFGESQPVSGNETDEGRAWNRRVELVAR